MKRFLLYLYIIIGLGQSCSSDPFEEADVITYSCSAENKVVEGNKVYFETKNANFHGAQGQSDDYAFEGDYSVKLDSINKYGFSVGFDDVEIGEFFEVTVWQKGVSQHGALIASVSGRSNFTIRSYYDHTSDNKGEWQQQFISFTISSPIDELKIYTFANGHTEYFDNMEIKRYKRRPKIDFAEKESLEIYIPDSNYQVLQKYIGAAVQEEVIRDEYKKYVDGYIIQNMDSIPVELRLKGDWTDHLVSGKTSYRIKTKGGFAYNGLRSFSIQHPSTRNYLHEWFAHRLCEKENLLSTYYDFLPVTINGIDQGVYAIEEHFDKQLLESRKRREGPILKFDESGFWAKLILENQLGHECLYPFYEASQISCFKKNRTTKSEVLFSQFNNGAILLNLFKNGYRNPEQIFDMDQMARYYAMMDLVNVRHSMTWHNRRFYYNPVTSKLEHIGFDMIPGGLPLSNISAVDQFSTATIPNDRYYLLDHYVFLNDEFRLSYTQYLKEFSSTAYLDSMFLLLESELDIQTRLMDYEMPNYKMNKDVYYNKAKKIRDELLTLDEKWDKFQRDFSSGDYQLKSIEYKQVDDRYHLNEISINPYLLKVDSTDYIVQIENYIPDSVEILGYSISKNKDSLIKFNNNYLLEGYYNTVDANYIEFHLTAKPSRIFYEIENEPGIIYSKKVAKWAIPIGVHPRIELKNNFSVRSHLYQTEKNKIILNKGSYSIDELIYIPKEFEVVVQPETYIDFINGGGLIINNSLTMMGDSINRIQLVSTDSTARGITVLGGNHVTIKNVEMDGFRTLDYKGWTLTGALTIYESENVVIENLSIKNNYCEDALNIIRSNFDITSLTISETFSDGFDADFCTGVFRNSVFFNTGNDCIDFSGSDVEISGIVITNSGDKGISAGERSNLNISYINIDGAITGIASKDDSKVTGHDVEVRNAEVGIAIFQKKPEYNSSIIELTNTTYANLLSSGWVELGSVAIINGKKYGGMVKFDIDAMYARFEK